MSTENYVFRSSQKKTITFLPSTVKSALFWLKTQQLRWTTPLAHQELPCSCDKLDFWQPSLFHGRNKSGNIFPRIYRCRKNTISSIVARNFTTGFFQSWSKDFAQPSCNGNKEAFPTSNFSPPQTILYSLRVVGLQQVKLSLTMTSRRTMVLSEIVFNGF